jgi:T-complex protein 1 subunit gamma
LYLHYFLLPVSKCLFFQHANGENAWVGIDGRSGDIVDMKERKVGLFLHVHCCIYPAFVVYTLKHHSIALSQIWDSYSVKAQTFKTAIEAACMLLRIDDIVSGIKKKQAPGASAPKQPQIEQEGDADNEQMIPE